LLLTQRENILVSSLANNLLGKIFKQKSMSPYVTLEVLSVRFNFSLKEERLLLDQLHSLVMQELGRPQILGE